MGVAPQISAFDHWNMAIITWENLPRYIMVIYDLNWFNGNGYNICYIMIYIYIMVYIDSRIAWNPSNDDEKPWTNWFRCKHISQWYGFNLRKNIACTTRELPYSICIYIYSFLGVAQISKVTHTISIHFYPCWDLSYFSCWVSPIAQHISRIMTF